MPSPRQSTYTLTNATRTHIHHKTPSSSFPFRQFMSSRRYQDEYDAFLAICFPFAACDLLAKTNKEKTSSTHHASSMRTRTLYLLLIFILICITFPITGHLFLVTWWINHMRRNNSPTFGARCDQLPPVVRGTASASFIAIVLNPLDEWSFECFCFVRRILKIFAVAKISKKNNNYYCLFVRLIQIFRILLRHRGSDQISISTHTNRFALCYSYRLRE